MIMLFAALATALHTWNTLPTIRQGHSHGFPLLDDERLQRIEHVTDDDDTHRTDTDKQRK